jgi:hypothetical protein
MIMWRNSHLTDEQLLLAIDGELAPRRASRVRTHLGRCSFCRARSARLERTLSAFIDAHREQMNEGISQSNTAAATLRNRLHQMDAPDGLMLWRRGPGTVPVWSWIAGAGAMLALLILVFRLSPISSLLSPATMISLSRKPAWAEPKSNLTPGATRLITASDVCTQQEQNSTSAIPSAIRQKVFQEYGLTNVRASDYELDYLITPELGGATDIRNLWPEPYTLTEWNAHVKDALENLLHQKVCSGEIDLPTAQHEIASDWISAYKKYFRTDRPLASPHFEPSSGLDPIDEGPNEEFLSVRLSGFDTRQWYPAR